MLKVLNRLTLTLAAHLDAAAAVAVVSTMGTARLNELAIGDHILLDLADGRGFETVQYTHTGPLSAAPGGNVSLPITRAVDGTALNWPRSMCLLQSTGEVFMAQLICKHKGSCP
jgi:hypothetical protein